LYQEQRGSGTYHPGAKEKVKPGFPCVEPIEMSSSIRPSMGKREVVVFKKQIRAPIVSGCGGKEVVKDAVPGRTNKISPERRPVYRGGKNDLQEADAGFVLFEADNMSWHELGRRSGFPRQTGGEPSGMAEQGRKNRRTLSSLSGRSVFKKLRVGKGRSGSSRS